MSSLEEGSSTAGLMEVHDKLVPDLPSKMKDLGVDAERVDEFISLLQKCNVNTYGALSIFSPKCPALVSMMYDTSTTIGQLQSDGFLATLRVSPRAHHHSLRCALPL